MITSGVRSRNIQDRNSEEILFMMGLPKDICFNAEQIQAMRSIWEARGEAMERFRSKRGTRLTGTMKAPLILVGFQGKPFASNASDFELLVNQPNYTANGTITGSVHDFFYDNSYGQLQFSVDVFGPYTMSESISSYNPHEGGNSQDMAIEAVQAAYADGCDFSEYDFDGNGSVDGLHLIFAGHGQEAGAPAHNSIWSHASYIYSTDLTLNGKRIYRFSCSPEYRDNSGTAITYIGVIAHELSHVFGLPDFYDTDYDGSNGTSVHLGPWDIMASGSWNDDGRTPANHNAYSKIIMGWVDPITLETPGEVTIPNPVETGAAYIIEMWDPDYEFFVLENRQKQGWDAFIPNNGMLIYYYNGYGLGWHSNCINCDPYERGFYIKQAGGGLNSNSTNRTTDPYPSMGNTAFTDETVPNSVSEFGIPTEKPITDIVHHTDDSTITFNFMGGLNAEFNVTVQPYTANTGTVTGGGTYLVGENVTVRALAAEGYLFKYWTIGDGNIVSYSNDYTFELYRNTTLYAHFHSCDATLADLVVRDAFSMSPNFNPTHFHYEVAIPQDITLVKITGFVNHTGALVNGNGSFQMIETVKNFEIQVTAEDRITTNTYHVTVTKTSDIDELSNDLLIYPNPASDKIYIETNKFISSIQLFDVQGRVLQNFTRQKVEKMEIDLSSYSAGIYFLAIDGEVHKVIIEE